jgi:transposase
MAFREVGMFEIKEVLRLWHAKVPRKAIARTVGLDVKTVRRYVAAAEELGIEAPVDDAQLAALYAELRQAVERDKGEAYRRCELHRERIAKWLRDGVRLTKIRKLLKRHDVDVPYSTLHRFAVRELEFGRRGRSSVRLVDPAPGLELQVDTGWVVTLTVYGGTRRKKAFIFTPSVSRHRFVFPIERETTEAAIAACEAAWAFYGGVFAVLLPDNTGAIIAKASPTSPKIVEAFREYAQARDFTVDPARVGKPKDKARVERTVRFVREDCFGGEVLASLAAAHTRALFWSEHEAGVRIHQTTRRRPKEHFLADEQPHLLPEPTEAYDVPTWATLTVDQTQHVSLCEGLYMLPEHVRGKVRARVDSKLVRFYRRGVLVKVLPRAAPGQRSFDAHDIPEHKRAYALRDERFLAEQARAHDDAIGDFADRLLEGRAPWMRMRRVAALLGFVRRFGVVRVRDACRRALEAEMHDVDRLRRMVEQPAPKDERPLARVIPIARYLRPSSTWAINPNDGETS